HDADALRWVSDEVVVVPAGLGFLAAAEDQARRKAAAASEAVVVEPAPVNPATLPGDQQALAFIRLPPPKQEGHIDLAVIPVEAILPNIGEPADVVIRGVFPIAGEPMTVIVFLFEPEGVKLVRVQIDESGPAWQNGLSRDYELAAVEAERE